MASRAVFTCQHIESGKKGDGFLQVLSIPREGESRRLPGFSLPKDTARAILGN